MHIYHDSDIAKWAKVAEELDATMALTSLTSGMAQAAVSALLGQSAGAVEVWAALLTTAPTTSVTTITTLAGNSAVEYSGGSYARSQGALNTPVTTTVGWYGTGSTSGGFWTASSSLVLTYGPLAATAGPFNIVGVGIMTLASAGNLLAYIPITGLSAVPNSATITITGAATSATAGQGTGGLWLAVQG